MQRSTLVGNGTQRPRICLSRRAAAALLAAVLLHSFAACPRQVAAARIIVYPLPWTSHSFVMAKLGAELNRRGHEVGNSTRLRAAARL